MNKSHPFFFITIIIAALILLFAPFALNAQETVEESTKDISAISLEELLDTEIEVASLFAEDELVVGSTVSSISPKKWKQLGARRMQEAMINETSFLVFPTILGANGVSIRGYANSQSNVGNAVMLDGIPVNNLTTGTAFYHLINWELGTLKKIEIIKGPGSAIYGSDAFHGVISMKTFESDKDHYEVEGSGAYPLYSDASFRLSQGFGEDLIRIDAAAGASRQGDQELEYETTSGDTGKRKFEYNSAAGVFKINIKPSEKLEIKSGAYGYYFDGEKFLGTEGAIPGGLELNDTSDSKTSFMMGNMSMEYTFANDVSIKANGFYWQSRLDSSLMVQPNGGHAENISKNLRTGGDLMVKQPDNPVNLQWLIAFSFNRMKIKEDSMIIRTADGTALPPPFSPGELGSTGMKRDINSVFCQLKWGIIKGALFLIAGARYDDYSDFDAQLTPRGGIIFLPTEKSSIKALYGRAFRAPVGQEIHGVGTVMSPSPDLEAENIDIYELIYIYQAKDWKLNLNGFYSNWENAIIGKRNPVRWMNEGKNIAYGGEMSLFYSFDIFAVDLGFSYAESIALDVESTTNPGTTEDLKYDAFPTYSIIAGIHYTFTPLDIKFYLNNRIYIDWIEAPESTRDDPEKLPDYYRTDLNISKIINNSLELYLDVRNILNRENHIPSVLGQKEGFTEPGISAMLRAGYTF